jgi:hypothetical protein
MIGFVTKRRRNDMLGCVCRVYRHRRQQNRRRAVSGVLLCLLAVAAAGYARAQTGESGSENTGQQSGAASPQTGAAPGRPGAAVAGANEPAPKPAGPPAILPRRVYVPGTEMMYQMHGENDGWVYTVDATSQVQQDAAGNGYEAIHWSHLQTNLNMHLSQASLEFEQTLSLSAPQKYLAVPDLSKVQPMLVGPITDLLTFYSDLCLATQYNLPAAGQHAFFAGKKPNSWADGHRTLLGQDAIDFVITLDTVDEEAHTATVVVDHVPPKKLEVKLPASWMQKPVHGMEPNNWVQVQVGDSGGYLAQVGNEQFEVKLTVDTKNGKLLAAHMDNTVQTLGKHCTDLQLDDCDAATPRTIVRTIDLKLMP